MPQIIVMADGTDRGTGAAVMFRERVNVSDFESDHFQNQLVERLEWAVGDADAAERDPIVVETSDEWDHESARPEAVLR